MSHKQLTIAILAHSYFGSHLRILAMAAQLIHEIESATAYCISRQSMNDSVSAPLAKNFANSIIQQINSCLTLSAQEATEVLEALKGSAYAEPDKKRIIAALENKIRTPHQAKLAGVTKEQVLTNPWAVCTEADWVVFRNPKAS